MELGDFGTITGKNITICEKWNQIFQ
jgi:hypothetical protein